jgi:hypothetical protein
MSDVAPPPEEPPVEIHKPHAAKTWKEFFIELGTITLGVLIALAAEQAVEWWRWRGQVAEARGVIATEMAQNLVGAVLRLRTEGCIERRLDALSDIVDAASRSGQLPPVGVIGQPPLRQWRSGAWQSVVAAETATHFPRQQLADLGSLYLQVERMEGLSQFEFQAWSNLYAMVGPGRRLDPASEADLRNALSLARATSRSYASQALTLVNRTRALGLPFNSNDLKQIADAMKISLTETRLNSPIPDTTSAICGPIGPVPPRYGQAHLAPTPAISDRAVKALPDFGAP